MAFCRTVSSVAGGLNESPSEKEGKSMRPSGPMYPATSLNESPSEKEGKWAPPRPTRP